MIDADHGKDLKAGQFFASCCGTAEQAAEKLASEGGGGFNPRIKPIE